MLRFASARALLLTALVLLPATLLADDSWPPALPNAKEGTATVRTPKLLDIPANVAEARTKEGASPFTMAKTPPTVELAYHQNLGPEAAKRRLWSSWGDIGLASDGRVYVGIGDHGDDAGGDARCFIYVWDPKTSTLKQIIDVGALVPDIKPHSRWSKIHAKIDEGPDGMIYFSGTLNDGNRAGTPKYTFSKECPGGQLYRYDPKTGKSTVFANLPERCCTATSFLDRERNLWWCNLESGAGNDALFCLDLATGKPIYQSQQGSVGFNRNFAVGRDGTIYFNGKESLCKVDPKSKEIVRLNTTFGDSPGIRCSTAETKAGEIYGITHKTTQLFRYKPAADKLDLLGPCWLSGSYTAVCTLSPDERFVYFLPGSHGGAFKDGTPVVQYDIAKGTRKVLAFLAPACEEAVGYVPAGTYGLKCSTDGSTLYVNFNGHPTEKNRPATMKPIGFGLTAFAAIHIPAGER